MVGVVSRREAFSTFLAHFGEMNSKIDIIFDHPDGSLVIEEIQEKGWRSDVRVRLGNKIYCFHFYHPVRLKQDIDNWSEKKNYNFIIDGILVVQNQLDNQSIREKITGMYEGGYFDGGHGNFSRSVD